MIKNTIYKTTGKAKEYCRYAFNIYTGCTHGCLYCYAPQVLHKKPGEFQSNGFPRFSKWALVVALNKIDFSIFESKKKSDPVLLSFISDPYQPLERELGLTRAVVFHFATLGIPFTILTKAGPLVQRDFPIYQRKPGCTFGTTLTFLDPMKSKHWEPGAALPGDRITNLIEAKRAGIKTWVSLEPVIDPIETIALIHTVAPWTDHFKVGKLNYNRLAEKIDWKIFASQAIEALKYEKKGFYIKKDLATFIGKSDGIKEGEQIP